MEPLRTPARGLGRQAEGPDFFRRRILPLPGVPTAGGGSATPGPGACCSAPLGLEGGPAEVGPAEGGNAGDAITKPRG